MQAFAPRAAGAGGRFPDPGAAPAWRGRPVNLFGIESPGLTSALAIGAHVRDMLGQ